MMSENVTAEAREFLLPLLHTVVVPDLYPFVLRLLGKLSSSSRLASQALPGSGVWLCRY